MKRALLLSTFILPAAMAAMTAPAQAACNVNSTPITCSGVSTGFTRNSDYNNLDIQVQTGAVVTRGSTDTIRIRGNGNTVTNNGTIIGDGANNEDDRTDAIDGGNDLTVYNYGSIDASNMGVDGRENLTVYNYGSINALNKGIDAELETGLEVYNYGSITAVSKGIRNQDGTNARLENYGLIESETHEGFESGDNAYVYNAEGASIIGSDDAIQVGENAEIHNHGLIHSVARGGDEENPQDGIDIDSGYIHNYATGVILSDDDAAIDYDGSDITSYIDNYGTISGTTGVLVEKGETGEEPNVAGQIIRNWGLIEGRDGLALDLGAGDDSLTLYAGSRLIGGADFGADNDSLILDGIFGEDIAGGALLDGGTGLNDVTFLNYGIGDIVASLFDDELAVVLSFASDESTFSINLANWTSFTFADGATYSYAALQDALDVPAAVPVPAAGLLMLGGLAGLAALRRRRA